MILFFRLVIALFLILGLGFLSVVKTESAQFDVHEFQGKSSENSRHRASVAIQEEAIADTARRLVRDMIGNRAYEERKDVIERSIIARASQFIPFVSPGPMQRLADGAWSMVVELKSSPDVLRQILDQVGLLGSSKASHRVFPMIGFQDRIEGRGWSFWSEGAYQEIAEGHLKTMVDAFNGGFRRSFSQGRLEVVMPESVRRASFEGAIFFLRPSLSSLRSFLSTNRIRTIVRGDIVLRTEGLSDIPQLEMAIQAYDMERDRILADIRETVSFTGMEIQSEGLQKAIHSILEETYLNMSERLGGIMTASSYIELEIRRSLDFEDIASLKSRIVAGVEGIHHVQERYHRGERLVLALYSHERPETVIRNINSVHTQLGFSQIERVDDLRLSVQ